MHKRQILGVTGEKLAEWWLSRQGVKIRARNWRKRAGELDLVGSEGGRIVFFEVKTRQNLAFGRPEEAVNQWKRQRLFRAARMYMAFNNLPEVPWQIDIVTVEIRSERVKFVRVRDVVWEEEI